MTPDNLSVSISIQVDCQEKDEINNQRTRVNEAIRTPQLRVIDADGKQIGVMSRSEALSQARSFDLDLVEISPNASPPVAKIIDWGKYSYQRTKQLQKSKKASKTLDVKQVRFGLKIGEHDLDVKLKKVSQFIEQGHKVRISVMFRGRELAHKELGDKMIDKIIERLGDQVIMDQSPQFAGRQLNAMLRSSNAKNQNP